MKKAILSLAIAGGLFVGGGPLATSAQSNVDTQTTYKVYQQNYQVSMNDYGNWNNYVQTILNQYFSRHQAPSTGNIVENKKEITVTEPEGTKQPESEEVAQPNPTPVEQQPVQQPPTQKSETVSYSLTQFEQKVVELTNAERAKYGLAPLKVDEKLSEVARTKSADMKQNGYFSHTSPTYGSPFEMMNQFGIQYRSAGENIAMGQQSPEAVVNAWMNSEGHRKNILSTSFTHIGVGHVEGNYWTQMFVGK